MVVLALLLLVVVAAVVVFVLVTGTTGTVDLTWEQLNLSFAPSPLVLFLLGAATLLLAVVALGMLRSGGRRGMAKRRELKRLRRIEKEQGTTADGRPADGRHDGHDAVPAGAQAPTGTHPAPQHQAGQHQAGQQVPQDTYQNPGTAPLPTSPTPPPAQQGTAPPLDARGNPTTVEPPKHG